MDLDKMNDVFLQEIKKRPIIYNKKDKNYRKTTMKWKSFLSIGEEMVKKGINFITVCDE